MGTTFDLLYKLKFIIYNKAPEMKVSDVTLR